MVSETQFHQPSGNDPSAGRVAVMTGVAAVLLAIMIGLFGPDRPAHAAEPAQETARAEGPPLLCERAVDAAETARGLPRYLMQAIALVESGHVSAAHGRRVAWPWTVMAEGKGRYYASKGEAIAAVEALQARGIRNIDVGCMQVNLHYHGHAFTSLAEAFEPVNNVAYATAFLMELRRDTRSWVKAVKHYHSTNRSYHMAYRAKVFDEWQRLKHAARRGGADTETPAAVQVASRDGGTGFDYLPGSSWPPRDYGTQQRLKSLVRSRVLSDSTR